MFQRNLASEENKIIKTDVHVKPTNLEFYLALENSNIFPTLAL